MPLLLLALALGPLQETEYVRVGPDGAITLAPRNATLHEHSDPAKFDVITDMTVYRGRLIAGACMDFDESSLYQASAYSADAQLIEYSAATDAWTVLRDMEHSMVFNLRVVDNTLLVPEYFPFKDRSRRIHSFDGERWGELGLLPEECWHIMDVIRIGDAMYASGSWRDLDPAARVQDPDWFKGYGHVFESKDGGRTWKDIRRTRAVGRVLDLVDFKGRLYANERGYQLIAWDGAAWKEIPVRFEKSKVDAKLGNAHLMVFADRIVAINADLVYTYDGRRWSSAQPGYIDLWREGDVLYGLREDGHVASTTDAVTWTRLTKEGVPSREFDREASRGRPIHRGALAMHGGRLFVGTGAEGRIYAGGFEERGSYTSAAHAFEAGTRLTLAWSAVDGVRMRYRTAGSADDLAKAPWKDASESPCVIAPPAKHRAAQWRADLQGNGRRTPVLRPVSLAP
jgi:hypothetical protein